MYKSMNFGKKIISLLTCLLTFIGVFGQNHFTPVWTGNGFDHMNIRIVTAQLNEVDLVAGDEIGIFDGTKCVGAGIIVTTLSQNNILPIVVSRNDGSGNGYITGNNISYKYFDKSEAIEITMVSATYYTNNPSWSADGKFAVGTSAFVSLSANYLLNRPPVADAGNDQIVNEGNLITLDGTASSDPDGNNLTYQWIVPVGISISSNTAIQPTFIAPEVSVNQQLLFILVVNDGMVESQPDTVIITIQNVVFPQQHFNAVWTGNGFDHMNINVFLAQLNHVDLDAGDEIGIYDGNKCVGAGTIVAPLTQSNILPIIVSRDDGSGNGYSTGNSIVYKFYKKSEELELTSVRATYNTSDPSWTSDGKFTIGATAFVSLDADFPVNTPPIADAGPDQTANEGVLITLDGSNSSDADGDSLSYSWTAPIGIQLSSITAIKPTFSAPDVTTDTIFIFTLEVNDGITSSIADTLIVMILNTSTPENQTFENQTFDSNTDACFGALQKITVAGNGSTVVLQNNAKVNLVAGLSIQFLPGFYAKEGCFLHAKITIDNTFCNEPGGNIVLEKSIVGKTTFTDRSILADKKQVKVYPNPNNGQFTLELFNFKEKTKVYIYNQLGALLYSKETSFSNKNEIQLPNISNGLYYVRVVEGKQQFVNKIIVN